MRALRALFVTVVVGLTACVPSASRIRDTHYMTERDRVIAVTEEVMAQRYTFRMTDDRPEGRSYEITPLWFDADRRPIPAPVGVPPDGSYRMTVFVGIAGRDAVGYYLDIRVAGVRYRDGKGRFYQSARPPDSGRTRDQLSSDSFLASLADPIFQGVYQRLEAVATHPPAVP